MQEVVRIKFRGRGKAYTFAANGISARVGDKLVVETAKGMELGECVEANHSLEEDKLPQGLRAVLRAATPDDLRVEEINRGREKEALAICREMIEKHGLEMKLVDVECSFEGNKILFFFTADGRVDFRELVRDLAGVFRTRIELRQIGVRDEAKMLGGLGICGRPFCCHQFLEDFQPVSTKMAKTQSMSLNPVKISGTCGRLMCCLRYEQEAYEDLVRHVPKAGAYVETEDGYGSVTLVNLLRQSVKVKLDGTGDPVFHTYPADEIAEVPGGRPAEGETPPHVLRPKPKARPEPREEPEDAWAMPVMLAEDSPGLQSAETQEQSPGQGRRRRSRGRGRDGKAAEGRERSENKGQRKNPPRPIVAGPAAPGGGQPAGKKNPGSRTRRGGRRRNRDEGKGE